LATLSKVKENIQNLKNKYKNIHKDFGLIFLCVSNDISNDIIDYLLSKYEKNDKYSDIYTCHLMQLLFSNKYEILELFLKNGFDVNRTLCFDGKEHNLLFYISERIHNVSRFSIETVLKYDIDINSKLKFNIDYQYRIRSIRGFIEKTISSKKNSILDVLIKNIMDYDSEYHYNILLTIFNYYCNIKENILILKYSIDNLNENSYRILVKNDNIKIIIIIISYCYFNKDEFFGSNFYKKILNYMPSCQTINEIESFYKVNELFLIKKEK